MDADSEAGSEAEELRHLVGELRAHLGLLGRSGLLGVARRPTPRRGPAPSPGAGGERAAGAVPSVEQSTEQALGRARDPALYPSGPGADRLGADRLAAVRAELGDCQRCKLAGGRKTLVFGVGNPRAQLVFVGEGPGADEDEQGEPFVGKAGQLLNKMIEAMGYRREEVYICNVVKCRPPGNRNPEPDEIAACEPFLKQQLAAIGPRMIVTLGKFAAQCLLRDDTPITRLRGRFRTYEGIPLMPTFHPAFLLRDPSRKKETWEDLKAVMQELKRLGAESA
jgi:DNA polymerase